MMQALVRTSRCGRIMRLRNRRLLSCFLLVTFIGISLLGEGLHWLTPETEQHHHHRHGFCVCAHHSHDASRDNRNAHFALHSHACADHAVCKSALANRQVVSNNDVESHVCSICAYLFQIASQPIEVAAPLEWQPLVVAVPILRDFIYSTSSLSSHAPRGPPVLT